LGAGHAPSIKTLNPRAASATRKGGWAVPFNNFSPAYARYTSGCHEKIASELDIALRCTRHLELISDFPQDA
jgi:hypothetical protein